MQAMRPLRTSSDVRDEPPLHVIACGDRTGGLQLHRIERRRSSSGGAAFAATCTALQKQGAAVLCLAALHRAAQASLCACFSAKRESCGGEPRSCDGVECSLAVATGCAGVLFCDSVWPAPHLQLIGCDGLPARRSAYMLMLECRERAISSAVQF